MQAMEHFNANRLQPARAVCEQVLALEPENGECLFLLGSIVLRSGDIPMACERYLQAASAAPDSLIGKLAMGFYLRQTGKLTDAVACFRQATTIAPNDPTPWTLLGETLRALGRSAEAQEIVMRLKKINDNAMKPQTVKPQTAKSKSKLAQHASTAKSSAQQAPTKLLPLDEHLYLAQALFKQDRFAEALGSYRTVLALQPDDVPALHGAALCLLHFKQYDEAISSLKQVLELRPNRTDALYDLVHGLIKQGEYEQAEIYARKLVQQEPKRTRAYASLGRALDEQLRAQEAAACYHKVLELDPGAHSIYLDLGTTAGRAGEIDEATLYYQKVLEKEPDSVTARFNLGLLLLLQGEFEQGWKYFEARLQLPDFAPMRASVPPWDGSSLADKTILIRAEQGMGDAIQFARYLPLLRAQGAHIKFMGHRVLETLFASLDCIEEWVDADAVKIMGVHAYSPLVSLPRMFGTRLETIPADVPYLLPNAELLEGWQERLAAYEGLRVGIVWAGNPGFPRDRERSCPLRAFLPLFDVPGVTLFSLQKGEKATAQMATLPPDRTLIALGEQLHTFDDTAAAILNLDLVISVDTSVAHLAGALAHPVWTLLPYANDWRWLQHREDSPWYPTMRLFRQPALQDWETVIRNVAAALTTEVAARGEGR